MNIDAIDDPTVVTRRADLSLHLTPHDLNLLSRAIGIHSGQEMKDLRPFLSVLVDTSEGGAFAVEPVWVHYVAALEPARVHAVAETWFGLMREEHSEPDLPVTSDALSAVAELVSLGKYAVQTDHQIIHIWSL